MTGDAADIARRAEEFMASCPDATPAEALQSIVLADLLAAAAAMSRPSGAAP